MQIALRGQAISANDCPPAQCNFWRLHSHRLASHYMTTASSLVHNSRAREINGPYVQGWWRCTDNIEICVQAFGKPMSKDGFMVEGIIKGKR